VAFFVVLKTGGEMVTERDEHGRFIKGTTPNPGGRPAGVAALFRSGTKDGKEVFDILIGIARDIETPAKQRIEACELILDRGWGKVAQEMKLGSDEESPMRMIVDVVYSNVAAKS
jgi:hypothetical protein